ncbi:hypothetical protein INT43_000284 [Umbelopsis isabellina]|uniref:MTOR-associated protein MEAK7 n=1 Tax=Mortierella isabellina TaxID=91625 RepID=A0A8H7Q2K9_MORIS|nr:hypothetical protein INT43_000284 [Umbelopsis isabellina]
MGNKQSSGASSTDLLAAFTADQQAQIKQQYAKAVAQSGAPDKHSKSAKLPRSAFEHALCSHVDLPLRQALASYLVALTNSDQDMITQEAFIKGAHALSTDVESIHALYSSTKACLPEFVSHIANSVIPIWWQGAEIGPEQWDSPNNKKACQRLADYLVYHKSPPTASSQWDEDNLFNTDNASNSGWNEEATRNVAADVFDKWYNHNLEFNILFNILIRSIFWPESTNADKDRAQHHLAPIMARRMLPQTQSYSHLLTPFDYFTLTVHMPADCLASTSTSKSSPHQLIFSSKIDGSSWQNFVNNITNQGALILAIKTTDGDVIGGFIDSALQLETRWTGNTSNFLYRLDPMGLWDASAGNNDHYQYLCWGKKSLPNGFGMGGQFDYCGLWLDADFSHGHSKAGPLCSTYSSPRLTSKEEFTIDMVEAWLVRPLPVDPNNPDPRSQGSVLNNAEGMAFLEMAGRKLYSKDLPQADKDQENDQNTQ